LQHALNIGNQCGVGPRQRFAIGNTGKAFAKADFSRSHRVRHRIDGRYFLRVTGIVAGVEILVLLPERGGTADAAHDLSLQTSIAPPIILNRSG
jgi:hypothetical protein